MRAATHAAMDRLCMDTLRTLSIDQVQKAGSGPPGTPIGVAPTVYTLWQRASNSPCTLLLPGDETTPTLGHKRLLSQATL